MFLENMDAQNAGTEVLSIEDRLKEQDSEYHFVNENIATNYIDAIEVMHGWMNSKEHRELLLNDQLTQIGSGAFVNYYTQIYLSEKE